MGVVSTSQEPPATPEARGQARAGFSLEASREKPHLDARPLARNCERTDSSGFKAPSLQPLVEPPQKTSEWQAGTPPRVCMAPRPRSLPQPALGHQAPWHRGTSPRTQTGRTQSAFHLPGAREREGSVALLVDGGLWRGAPMCWHNHPPLVLELRECGNIHVRTEQNRKPVKTDPGRARGAKAGGAETLWAEPRRLV